EVEAREVRARGHLEFADLDRVVAARDILEHALRVLQVVARLSACAILTVLPMATLPLSAFSLPRISLNNVDLPAPFGPMMPTIAPGGTLKESLSISRRSPKPFETSLNSITSLPRRSATGIKISCVSFLC